MIRLGLYLYRVFPRMWRRGNYRICLDGFRVTRLPRSISKVNILWVLRCSPLLNLQLVLEILFRLSICFHSTLLMLPLFYGLCIMFLPVFRIWFLMLSPIRFFTLKWPRRIYLWKGVSIHLQMSIPVEDLLTDLWSYFSYSMPKKNLNHKWNRYEVSIALPRVNSCTLSMHYTFVLYMKLYYVQNCKLHVLVLSNTFYNTTQDMSYTLKRVTSLWIQ